jgi:2-keto-4-pentenoate hydratase
MTESAVAETAEKIARAHRMRARFSPLDADRIGDLEFAYAVQDRLISLWQAAGEGEIIGWKVGVTSARMQDMVGISQPIAGAILSRHRHGSGAELHAADFVRLGIEAEIAVCIGTAIPETEMLEPAAILGRLAQVSVAFEVVEDRDADYKNLDAASLIADNSWNKGIVIGPPTAADRIVGLVGRRGVLTVNGEVLDQGMSEDVGGDPLRIVAWLAAHLARRGQALRPGQWVLTGSIVTTKFPRPGDLYHFGVDGLEPVEVRIA